MHSGDEPVGLCDTGLRAVVYCFQCSGLFNCFLCSFRLCSFSFFLFHAPTQKERKRTKRKKNAALGFCISCVHRAFWFSV